jgi:hypothetical protein
MSSPRAADDFMTIRARLEELRRERAEASPEAADDPSVTGTRPYRRGYEAEPEGHRLSQAIRQKRFG